ncbi:hypothetical protein RhiJN_22575 [Ceratobasidium sp. AG-Ba]|nr:hypothetical protein RhiJN_22575 [Ceratobasidium sp. AG-Ba]
MCDLTMSTATENEEQIIYLPNQLLCQLTKILGGLPVKLFIKVLLELYPGDILILARTCKSMHAILMSKSAAALWLVVERATPGLPRRCDCMSPPEYAALIYTENCSFCGDNKGVKLEFGLRVRLCKACHDTELVDIYSIESYQKDRLREYLSVTYKLPKTPSKYGPDLQKFYDNQYWPVSSGGKEGAHGWSDYQGCWAESHIEFAEQIRGFLIFQQLNPSQKLLLQSRDDLEHLWMLLNYENDYEDIHDMPYEEDEEVVIRNEVEMLLLKNQVDPFLPILKVLGPKATTVFRDLEGLASTTWPLLDSPAPTIDTLWSICGYKYVRELEISLKVQLIRTNPDLFLRCIEKWREDGEQQLVEWWLGAGHHSKADEHRVANPMVTIYGSTEATSLLSPQARFLLRADTIFKEQDPQHASRRYRCLHYPHFTREEELVFTYIDKWGVSTPLCRYFEAEKITNLFLERFGIPDAAYIELKLMGKRFVCQRCEYPQAMSWDALLFHYLYEFKPSNSTDGQSMTDLHRAHDISSADGTMPFVRMLAENEVEDDSAEDF